MATKTYANRSNARRAAKAAGLNPDELCFVQESQGACGWYWIPLEPAAQPAAPKAPRYRLHRRKAKAAAPAVAAATPATTTPAPGTNASAPGTTPRYKDFQVYGKSTALSPVKVVHDYLNAHGKALSRKQALCDLAAMGINYATARTQYQRWFSANK